MTTTETVYIPVLSKRNVERLLSEIDAFSPSLVVEFGSGGSTMFFIQALQGRTHVEFVSIENTASWFKSVYRAIRKRYTVNDFKKNRWALERYSLFYQGGKTPFIPVANGKSRYERWQRYVKLGPFYRFEPDSGSRLSMRSTKFIRPFLSALVSILRRFWIFRHYDATISAFAGNVEFHGILVSPGMKDQFGESPFRDDYADAWKPFAKDVLSILFLIDGGPRHYIIDRIESFKKERPYARIMIALFDAHRPEYVPVLTRLQGTFHTGSVDLLDNTVFYKEEPEKELWMCRL